VTQSTHSSSASRSRERGFTLLETIVVAAILFLLISLTLPSSLGGRNKAALDEANTMANQWRTLAWGCYLQTSNAAACANNATIGFSEHPGRYWD